MARKITAVYSGHVSWRQHGQRAGVVPVEQMAVVFRQALHRVQGGLQPLDHAIDRNPAELARAGHRQQIQADVGRRGAVGDSGFGLHLQVVGRQVTVIWSDTSLKKLPGLARQLVKVLTVARVERRVRQVGQGSAGPPSCQRAERPQQEQRRPSHRMRAPVGRQRQGQTQKRQARVAADKRAQAVPGRCLHRSGCGPFKQFFAARDHAPERACHGVRQHEGLGGELAQLPGAGSKAAHHLAYANVEKMQPGDAATGRHQTCQCTH